MSITAIGFVIIPISFAIFFAAPYQLLPWAIAVSVLQAASILNVGGAFPIGVTPFFFVTILICLRFGPLWLSGRLGFGGDEYIRAYLCPLLLFALWGLVSCFLLPSFFAGTPVDSPRAGMDADAMAPLHWSLSNAAQGAYLGLSCIFVIYVVWESIDRLQLERCIAAFRWSGAFAAGVGAYQLAAHVTGLPFPTTFFNSNLAWAQLTNQTIGGAWRISATFTEPSAAGSYFVMWTSLLLVSTIDNEKATWSEWLLLLSGLAMLALTTSTTGYITGAVVLLLLFGKQMSHLLVGGVIGRRVMLVIVILTFIFTLGILLLPHAGQVLREAIWEKSQSGSGSHRTATAMHALYLVPQTFGLGAGLGSNRPSGMLFYLVSNLGIPGLLLFINMLYVSRALAIQAAGSIECGLVPAIRAHGWAFIAILLAMIISGADITSSQLWVPWAIFLGACRYAYLSQSLEDNVFVREAFPSMPRFDPILLVDAYDDALASDQILLIDQILPAQRTI